MANTYSQLYNHFVFAVQDRKCYINTTWKQELYKYMSGITEKYKCKTFKINGMPDHIHMLVSMAPNVSPSELMYDVKRSSSIWINKKKLLQYKFSWQEGFGVFSYGKSQIQDICHYIENQEIHHRKRSFVEEYKRFLDLFEIDYDERYIFKQL